jgi:phosphoribosylaminoimidazole carboxylase PurE protein
MEPVQVAILMGSKSDVEIMKESAKILKDFDVSFDMKVLSAHRTPKETAEYAENFKKSGGKVFICGAGMSAALSGVVAAHTTLPVVGVPLDASSLQGMDALLSTAQMPPGIPVGAVAIGKAGAKNAAFLALRILGLNDEKIVDRLTAYAAANRKKILETEI